MITDVIFQLLLGVVSALFAPVFILLNPVYDSIAPFLDSTFSTLKMLLSWASVFVQPQILRAYLLYIPAIWGFLAVGHITKWVINLVRG